MRVRFGINELADRMLQSTVGAMHLVSINVAQPSQTDLNGTTFFTAIDKQPVDGPVNVHALGLEGDGVGSTKHHGGPGQAVYAYGTEDSAWWASELGRDIPPAWFGENLTVSNFSSATARVGDRWAIGTCEFQVTGPRIPCGKLSARMHQGNFGADFRKAGRPGVYLRVLTEGTITNGDEVAITRSSGISVLAVADLFFNTRASEDQLTEALQSPLSERALELFASRLASGKE